MSFDSIAPARALINVLRITGLWYYTKPYWSVGYRLYGMLTYSVLSLTMFLGMLTNMAYSFHDYDQLTDALYMTFTMIATSFKGFIFLRNAHTTRELYEILEKTPEALPNTPAELEIVKAEFQAFNRLRNFYFFGIFAVLLFGNISGILHWTLPFPCWIPFDYQTSPKFYYAYWYITFGMLYSAVTCGTIDLSVAFLLFQLANCYKMLAQRLELLGTDAGDNAELQLKQLLEFHRFIVDTTSKCENLISLPILMQICISAFVICFTAFRLNTMHFFDDPIRFLVLFTFGYVMALQIFLPCSYGNELTLSAGNLVDAIYNSKWFDLPLQTQKHIFTYMEYLKQPVAVRAGNFFGIGLPIFTQTMNNAYRLYAVLVNMKQ